MLALLAVLLAADAPAAPAPPERTSVEVDDPRLKKDIDRCIARSTAWIRARQRDDGSWPELDDLPMYGGGAHAVRYRAELSALALLALLKAGVPPTDPCVEKAFAYLRPQGFTTSGAYGCGVVLMCLEASGAGLEGAVESPKGKGKKPALSSDRTAWAAALVAKILKLQAENGGWRYASPPPSDLEGDLPGTADVSATQYALLGLKAARRMGIPVDPEVFARAAGFLLDQQESDGKGVQRVTYRVGNAEEDSEVGYGDRCRGWAYMKGAADPQDASASLGMTCAGLVGMLICRSELLEAKAWKPSDRVRRLAAMEKAVWDGLAWVDAHWSVEENVPRGAYELGYALYALERVGMMADLRFIGPGHDWYAQGARVWTSRMTDDGPDTGHWELGAGRARQETQDTPYGLLFLKKASLRLGYPIGEDPRK